MANIYFVEAIGLNLVKIGRTEQLNQRLAQLSKECPVPIRLRAIIKNVPTNTELMAHRAFADDRSHGEWFHITKRLEDFMKNPTPQSLKQYYLIMKGLKVLPPTQA